MHATRNELAEEEEGEKNWTEMEYNAEGIGP